MLTPKLRVELRIYPRNHKISHLFNKQPAEGQAPIAREVSLGDVVRTAVGARHAGDTMVGPTIVVMAGAGDTGVGADGRPELLGVREATSVGGLSH